MSTLILILESAAAVELDASRILYGGQAIYLAQGVLLVMGMLVAGYWAYQAFDAPPINLGDGPTLPRYMTQPVQYRLGVITYVGACLVVYILIAYFHRELTPLVGSFSPDWQKIIENAMTDGSLSYPAVVILSAGVFLTLLKIDRDWNPLFVLRSVVHGWVSIPQLANAIMIMMRDELIVPVDARSGVVEDPETPFVALGDFDKDRLSIDRQWAELSYIKRWLAHKRALGSHFLFFNEPSFAWDKLQSEFTVVLKRIGPIKEGKVTDPNIFEDVAGKVGNLRRQFCRLAACFLVFKNETKKNALRDASQFGVKLEPDFHRANPMRYAVIFTVAIMLSIYVGVTITPMVWDLVRGHELPEVLKQDPELVTRWITYALATYGVPIFTVLLLRYLGWTNDPGQPNSYLVSYATIFLIALVISAISLAIANVIAGSPAAQNSTFTQLLFTRFKWCISPAVVSVYVTYHVDRQIDPALPDIGSSQYWRAPQRLLSCLFFGFLVTLFTTLPALTISGNAASPWPVEKLRVVIIGTTFVIGLIMAVVGEFFLLKPKA